MRYRVYANKFGRTARIPTQNVASPEDINFHNSHIVKRENVFYHENFFVAKSLHKYEYIRVYAHIFSSQTIFFRRHKLWHLATKQLQKTKLIGREFSACMGTYALTWFAYSAERKKYEKNLFSLLFCFVIK